MILCALLAVAAQADSPFAPTETKSALDVAHETHLRVVRAEREFQFFARYTFAPPEARARARSLLERLRTPGAASGATSTTPALARASRALEEPPPNADAKLLREALRLQELVDALDLQATPTFFSEGTVTEGHLLRVLVYPIYPPAERLSSVLSLYWTQPDGLENLAFRGLTQPSLFEPSGFSVEVPAPGNTVGRWYLTLELEREGLRVRGEALELQCVPQLGERSEQVFEGLSERADPRQTLARWLALASQRGLRTLALLDCDAQLARLEARPRAFEPYPWALAFEDADFDPHWIWRLDPAGEAVATLVLLTPSVEPPEAQLSRPEWSDFARLDGLRILATHLPPGSGKENAPAALFERLAEAGGGKPLICVARGDAIGQLAMSFHASKARPYAAEVLALSAAPADPSALGTLVPRLVFAPGGSADADAASAKIADNVWWLDGPSLELFSSFELPIQLRGALRELWPQFVRAAKATK
jgi:hypothetical protein